MNDTTFRGTGMVIKVPVIVGKPRKRTNADRIRSMDDEKLTTFLDSIGCCPPNKEECCIGFDCAACLLDWLKQEAK